MAATWYQVTCDVPAQLAETVADYLADLSGCGVCTENRDVDSFSPDDIPELAIAQITCYFSLPCRIEQQLAQITGFLAALPGYIPAAPPRVSLLGEEDWASSWKAHFKPLAIGQRLLITPSWETGRQDEGRAVIVLDPGMAFGTGGHETTRLCLECLEGLLVPPPEQLEQIKILDLGTGSGILAIAAAKLGALQIDAVDIDPQAVIVAEENCALNKVADRISCSTTPLEQLGDGYRIILANILAEELVRMAPGIVSRMAPGGSLILSGILAEREALVRNGFDPFPLSFEASLAAGEWRCLHYRRLP
ncbi:50S ribosomal protein L11 methyltransferase [Trichlorobacter lovleyi]|uniref:50S ribosomal protein L11 methyltransferase n=1 Tax=Trichlorobacter lovleyi TaxID=313985 RepID=UPI0024807EA0|nr:50S ribosomal protein L11 methyltransferase [Trichlorobacter lovleyi]